MEYANGVLQATTPEAKSEAAFAAVAASAASAPMGDFLQIPPIRPKRPDSPALVPPSAVPRRRFGSTHGRAALLHAIAHIEFNAIDLAFDMAARFAGEVERLELDASAFMGDWFEVGGDEARHFGLISNRLADLGSSYGAFPAHDGLWEAAEATTDNLLARLAVAPLILEARGLDVTPSMANRLRGSGDPDSAEILDIIYRDEIGHVACGNRWFSRICQIHAYNPVATFHSLKARYFAGMLKPPFNHEARDKAGLPRAYYEPN
ncbi:MAG: ferritin-like domain-containing protein [Marinicaulis sp.]|nr:ferritin-like domain-containing protein [Marinicaulis sp.]